MNFNKHRYTKYKQINISNKFVQLILKILKPQSSLPKIFVQNAFFNTQLKKHLFDIQVLRNHIFTIFSIIFSDFVAEQPQFPLSKLSSLIVMGSNGSMKLNEWFSLGAILCYLASDEFLSYYMKNKCQNVNNFTDFILILMAMQRNKKKQEWSTQELQLLKDLYPEYTSKKWKRISETFRAKGFHRSEIDCREKWINFVDPSINKKEWQEWQLRRMYQIHAEMGTRWCLVQKQIGRTQNKIKNRFYGTLRNFIRFLLNHFDNDNSSLKYQITKLPPKLLNQMYNSQNSFFYLKGEVKNAIFQMGFKIDKKIMNQRLRENRSLYSKLHQSLVNVFQSQSQPPAYSTPLQSSQVSLMNHQEKDESQQENAALKRREGDQFREHQRSVQKQLDLPCMSQSLQKIYLHQNYYYPQSSPMLYYIVSYL